MFGIDGLGYYIVFVVVDGVFLIEGVEECVRVVFYIVCDYFVVIMD